MTTDDLLVTLARNGTRILLDETGHALRIRGGQLTPALLEAVKARKPALVAALQEARALAWDLIRTGDTEAFAVELYGARERGELSIADWCSADLALKLACRWAYVERDQAA